MSDGRWIQAPPIQPGWYWYKDEPVGTVVLRVDECKLAWGSFCMGCEIEKLPGAWWSELLREPI